MRRAALIAAFVIVAAPVAAGELAEARRAFEGAVKACGKMPSDKRETCLWGIKDRLGRYTIQLEELADDMKKLQTR